MEEKDKSIVFSTGKELLPAGEVYSGEGAWMEEREEGGGVMRNATGGKGKSKMEMGDRGDMCYFANLRLLGLSE